MRSNTRSTSSICSLLTRVRPPGLHGREPRGGGGCNRTDPMEGRPEEDAELFARAQRGNVDAYEEIVQRYQQLAFRTAYVITRSAAEAEEAAQDAFVKAYRALDSFRTGAEPRPWLLRIVANEARNRVRSAGRRQRLELRLAEGFRQGDAAPSPEAAAVDADERRRLIGLVNELDENDRQVIARRHL